MKAVKKLVLLLSAGALASVVASAATPERAYLESCRKAPGVPVPVRVVTPLVGPEFIGATVQLQFVVDAQGRPVDVSVQSSPDRELGLQVVDAVKQWRFQPAEVDGKAVATKVALPVNIIEQTVQGPRYIASR